MRREVTGCDHPKFSPYRSIGRRVIAFPTFSNMTAVRHLELDFCHSRILDHPRSSLCSSITLTIYGVDLTFVVGDIAILWFCQFGWIIPNHAPFLGFQGVWTALKLWIVKQKPQKAHPWVKTRHLSHKRLKSVQGFNLGAIARKKYNQDRTGQDRTTKKSQNRNISHIWGQAPCKVIAMKFGTGVDVYKWVQWCSGWVSDS